jgi:hypothetical protein
MRVRRCSPIWYKMGTYIQKVPCHREPCSHFARFFTRFRNSGGKVSTGRFSHKFKTRQGDWTSGSGYHAPPRSNSKSRKISLQFFRLLKVTARRADVGRMIYMRLLNSTFDKTPLSETLPAVTR